MEQNTEMMMTAKDIVAAVNDEGTITPLDGYVRLKRMEREVADALSKVKAGAIKEAAEYGKGRHEAFGAIVETKSAAGRWDFSSLPWYTSLNMMMETKMGQAKAAFAAREKMQPLPVDMETNEEIQPASYTPGSEAVSISLPK